MCVTEVSFEASSFCVWFRSACVFVCNEVEVRRARVSIKIRIVSALISTVRHTLLQMQIFGGGCVTKFAGRFTRAPFSLGENVREEMGKWDMFFLLSSCANNHDIVLNIPCVYFGHKPGEMGVMWWWCGINYHFHTCHPKPPFYAKNIKNMWVVLEMAKCSEDFFLS